MKNETAQCAELVVTPLVDQLKAKRSRMAKEHNAKMRKLDRTIELLEGSDAENILRDAEKALFDE